MKVPLCREQLQSSTEIIFPPKGPAISGPGGKGGPEGIEGLGLGSGPVPGPGFGPGLGPAGPKGGLT